MASIPPRGQETKFPLSPPLPLALEVGFLSSFFLEVGPLNTAKGSEERCVVSLFSGVWGGAPAEIEFGAF